MSSGHPSRAASEHAPRRAAGEAPTSHAAPRRGVVDHDFGPAIAWTVLGTLIPGLGLIRAGRRVAGGLALLVAAGIVGVLGWVIAGGRSRIATLALNPSVLIGLAIGLPIIALGWVTVIAATHLALRPEVVKTAQRIGGGALVTLLSVLVATPLAVGSQYSYLSASLVTTMFSDEPADPTQPEPSEAADPWANQPRLNVLVIGGDTEKKRDPSLGLRADSVMVASIDTRTGATTLFSLPRQTARIPFPADSPLHRYFPNGFTNGNGADPNYFLNAMYNEIPPRLPAGLLGSRVKNVGAEVMKIGVGEALGLGKLDYYVAFSMDGFKAFINAVGGVTLNVNYRIPIGGKSSEGVPPTDWIEVGKNQHMDGRRALWYARGRYSLDDYSRIERQRCVINAVVEQTKPDVVLTRFNAIAAAGANNVITDVPRSKLPALLELAFKVKETKLHSVVFKPGVAGWVSANPDWPAVRKRVQAALKETAAEVEAGPTPSATTSPSSSKTPTKTPTASPTTKSENLEDACAYHPEDYKKP